jgi:hypothetical protein
LTFCATHGLMNPELRTSGTLKGVGAYRQTSLSQSGSATSRFSGRSGP